MIKPIFKKIAITATIILVFSVFMAFPFGPLLPWSPIKPGYSSVSYAHADVYFNRAEALPDDYRELDQMMKEAEEFHHLKFHRTVKVIACKSWSDCDRVLPWMNVRPLGGVTLATGDVISGQWPPKE